MMNNKLKKLHHDGNVKMDLWKSLINEIKSMFHHKLMFFEYMDRKRFTSLKKTTGKISAVPFVTHLQSV